MQNKALPHRFFSRRTFIPALIILLIVLLYLAFILLNPTYSVPEVTLLFVNAAVTKQQKIETDLLAFYEAGNYTFMEPLVIQDPYQTAPLTALLLFDTPDEKQISIHIPGKNPLSSVDYTFPGYHTHHEIPIFGLYADTLNHVTISMISLDGEVAQRIIDLQTEPLPIFLHDVVVDSVDQTKYAPGFTFTTLSDKIIFDLDGNVRWYSLLDSWAVLTNLQNGHYLFSYSVFGELQGDVVMERDLLGKIYAIYHMVDGIHHEIYELPGGNLLVSSADMKSDWIEDFIIEVDRSSGHIVRSYDLKEVLDEGRPHQVEQLPNNDWLHLNSIIYDSTDESIIISSKGQSAVVKMSYPGLRIQWILGPHDNWSPKYQPFLLTPIGDEFEWSWSHHHATLYSPNILGDDLVDILLYDNAMYRSFESATAYPVSEWYSRVVHYRVDEASMTVEQVWEYGQDRGPELFSATRGSAYRLSNGNVLGAWGDIFKDKWGNPTIKSQEDGITIAKIIEVDPTNSEVVFETTIPGAELYRAMRIGLYDDYSNENDYLSVRLNDTTGSDLFDRHMMALRDFKRWTITPLLSWLKEVRDNLVKLAR